MVKPLEYIKMCYPNSLFTVSIFRNLNVIASTHFKATHFPFLITKGLYNNLISISNNATTILVISHSIATNLISPPYNIYFLVLLIKVFL